MNEDGLSVFEGCDHTLAEREMECADGACPICAAQELAAARRAAEAEIAELRDRLTTVEIMTAGAGRAKDLEVLRQNCLTANFHARAALSTRALLQRGAKEGE